MTATPSPPTWRVSIWTNDGQPVSDAQLDELRANLGTQTVVTDVIDVIRTSAGALMATVDVEAENAVEVWSGFGHGVSAFANALEGAGISLVSTDETSSKGWFAGGKVDRVQHPSASVALTMS
jgi:hypothetical protein